MNGSGLFEKAFRLRFGLKLCVLTILGAGAVTVFLYAVTSQSLGGSYGQAIYNIYDLKIRIFPLIFSSFYSIFILAVVTAAMALISMFFSHKIAGPMFRIGKNLGLIGGGDLSVQTKFRGNDQLVSLAEDINAMVRSLNHTARGLGEALEDLKARQERLTVLLNDGGATEGELKEGIEALRIGVQELKRLSSGIKAEE